MINSISNKTVVQFIRYVIVGISVNLIGYCFYLLITYLGIPPKNTMTLLYTIGVILGYIGHKKISFSHSGSKVITGVKFILAHAVGYLINLGMLMYFADKLHYPHQFVQAAAIFVVALYLFIVFKTFVFKVEKVD
jgi:putative flippase GtrA